ncbi:cation-independent mannose-6-phosphate receptor [Toxorhynchites rutilus septentrionalis]|uniref:cation-independent mannose-6-phosphate receptor n=1 Tax=Toxorhynchites rutilus septentrionalis TaxID=329112 RepID=UPI002479323E|nr:cation-independent mannose-6-phosphate receptor [Toxorhynchites rutilus septentrionalis]XP_055618321.1 cation-independent mannose-6-phosphate receptor [Toxorhynchites rutilus septentrionalis]XP_055618322.1 cation-independent mannose-6-phosphate receptor [Toxorhynchites rutilus septentrionalis]XP_055618323.1 cation-independent mannose-6-phosphate receptor [Toxorhynchites rutilus septentrionalis]XP_055618325.1 cation-independent mannose-6-phosphate receptor [Toxorhynchites rutilus septentriona
MSTSGKKSICAKVGGLRHCMVGAIMVLLLPSGSSGNSLILTGENCTLREPLYNIAFDLNPLNSELAHHASSDNNEKFLFDVCDQLDAPCNGVSGGAACLHRKDGTEVLLGMKSTLQLVDGRIHFNFSGGEACHANQHYSLDIILLCSYTVEKDPMNVIPYSPDQCNYFMFWRTKLACAPLPDRLKSNECAVTDSTGHVYNLLPLSHVNHHVPDRDGSHFFVTACKPVHYGHMVMCPPGASVCYVNAEETDYARKYHDYGQTDPNPTIEEGKLVMNLKSNEGNCQHSKIIFECDQSAVEETPEYIGKEGCTYLFSWRTSLACKTKESCAVIDPISGKLFNMTLLANRKYTMEKGDLTYEFGICSMSAHSQCPDQSGACQVTKNNTQAMSLGAINDNLLYNITGAPFLRYTSGSICNPSGQRWSTKIEFVCETDKGEYAPPKLVENTNCELIIQLETELACTREISCLAMNFSNDDEVDLSSLISAEANYEARINDTLAIAKDKRLKFFLNVCRPLLPKFGLGCPGGSAACLAIQGPNDPTPTNELSLGYPDVSLTVVGDRAQLKYLRGDICPGDNSTELSTEIEFYCRTTEGLGSPILQEVLHDCHYRFEWPTSAVCPSFDVAFRAEGCEVANNQTGETLDFRKIFERGEISVRPAKNSVSQELRDGKIQICDKIVSAVVDYRDHSVNVYFAVAEASCERTRGFMKVNMRVVCEPDESYVINQQSPCHLLMTQTSPKVCAFVGATVSNRSEPHPPNDGNHSGATDKPANQTDTNNSVTDDVGGGTVGIILAVLTLISLAGAAAFLLLRNPERRANMRELLRGRNVLVQYSRVRTNEEAASLLMQPPGTLSESDDEMLI